jgi:hypothetical protein
MLIKVLFMGLILCCVEAAQTTLNVSEDLIRLGIASSNMVPNQPSQDAGPIFFQAVSYANSHQIGHVIADPGAYYFRSLPANIPRNQQVAGSIPAGGSNFQRFPPETDQLSYLLAALQLRIHHAHESVGARPRAGRQ